MRNRIAALGFVVVATPAAFAQSAPSGPVCIRTELIDHSRVKDDRTILFTMRDKKVWAAKLLGHCTDLRSNGFAYEPAQPSQICANLQTIHVLRTGAACMIGPIEPYAPPS